MRLLLVALLAFALSACWTGLDLYSASDARALLAPGTYRVTPPNEPAKIYRVSMLDNGMTELDDGDEKDHYGFTPLAGDPNAFVGWMQAGGAAAVPRDKPDQTYMLVVRHSDGTLQIQLPGCNGADAELARKAGATVDASECRFPTRASLESALRLLPRDEKSAIRVVRI